MHQALRLARTSAFMMDGEVVETGLTGDLLASPLDARTARFIKGDIP
jgi:ABC-type phosphate transport system ATPase subunit